MKIRICGAAGGEVTGSSYLVQTNRSRVVIDFGLFQGSRNSEAKNKIPTGLHPRKTDAVLLTHGHLDHTGRLPMLVKLGYSHPIYATPPTIDLTRIILKDSARLQVADAIHYNKKHWKPGQKPQEALYTSDHVDQMMELMSPVEYHTPVQVTSDIRARWIPAGHMLGSASIELTILEDNKEKIVLFSGDLGPLNLPLLKPYEQVKQADLVFMESTYGDRNHKSLDETLAEFTSIVNQSIEKKGKILVPSFAIGRAQQLIYHLAESFHNGSIKPFPVYIDSPMALDATGIYRRHFDEMDDEFKALQKKGVFPFNDKYFIASPTPETSKKLNELKGPAMIIAGAGMCNGGRILHHIFHHISDAANTLMIVGYQSHGSLGRRLIEGEKKISLFGERIQVRAAIRTLGGFSAHAGQDDLLNWFSSLAPARPKLYLTHGEDGPRATLAGQIKKKFGNSATLPALGDVASL